MQVNDQISRYQAEFYTESVHDAFVNVQRLLNDYTSQINCIEDSIEEEKTYRKQTRRQRMKKPAAVFLLLIGLIFILLTIALLGATGYAGYTWYTKGTLPEVVPFEPLVAAIIGLVAYVIVLIITVNIFKARRAVGRRLNIKKAKKILKGKIEIAEKLTETIASYPDIYEKIHILLVKTKRHPLGKVLIDKQDKEAIDTVKSFCYTSESATKLYEIRVNA